MEIKNTSEILHMTTKDNVISSSVQWCKNNFWIWPWNVQACSSEKQSQPQDLAGFVFPTILLVMLIKDDMR
jgi:hypothetical protein